MQVLTIQQTIFRLAMVCFVVPVLAAAQDDWRQDEAAGVVRELLESLNRIVDMSGGEGVRQPDAVQNKNAQAALVDIRVLVEEVERLDLALTAGNSKAQTFAQYQRISNLRYSVRDYAREIEIREDILGEVEAAGKLLHELDLMYVE